MRVWKETDVGQLCDNPVHFVLHVEFNQLSQRIELCSAAEPHLFLVCFDIVMHISVDLVLWVEVFHLGMKFDRINVAVLTPPMPMPSPICEGFCYN